MDVQVEPNFFSSHDSLKQYKLLPDAEKRTVASEFLSSMMQKIIEREVLTFTLQSTADLQIGPYCGRKFVYEVIDTEAKEPPGEFCMLLLLVENCDMLVQLTTFRLKTMLRKVDHDSVELENSIKAFSGSLTYSNPNTH